jgi:hypothetical protein
MKPLKGIFLDVRPEDQPEGTYPFGKNGVQFDLKGTIVNEEGFKQIQNIIPQGYQINGILETDVNKVIVFYTNNINSGVMLYNFNITNFDYNFIDSSLPYKLGFKIDNYITGQVQRNHKGELICVFTDKVTFPKFINLDTPDTAQLKSWRLFSEFLAPLIVKQVILGGNLAVGSYYIASRYYKDDGTITSFSRVSNGVVVIDDSGNDYADKSLELVISNQDTSYKFLELAIISKVNGVTKAILMDKIPVVPSPITVVFTGDGNYTDVSLEEVLTAQVRYEKVGTVTQLNDALYLGNLEKLPDITDMQKYANLVKLEWVSELIDAMSPPEEHVTGQKKSFMHEEVYAFYIRYRFFNGSYSLAFTIPGNPLLAAHAATSTVGTTGALTSGLVYEVEDTITSYNALSFSGLTGGYENKTELYPNTDDFDSSLLGGEDLRNQPVRHHKMPSLRWCKANLYDTEADYGKTKLDILGIRASNIQIPSQYQNLIDGYEILYAKRTTQNMTVYGQNLVLYGSKLNTDPANSYSNGHNWHVDGGVYAVDTSKCRLHAFDLLHNRPGIKPSHLSHQYRLKTKVDVKYTPWGYPSSGSPSDGKGVGVYLSDMTDANGTVINNVGGNFVNALEDPKWVKYHSVNGIYQNTYMETTLASGLLGAPQITSSFPNASAMTLFPASWPFVEAYLANVCDIKENVYSSFYAQPLISAGEPKLLSDASPFFGGDIFISVYSFHTYGIMDQNWATPYDSGGLFAYPENRTRRVVHRFVCETIGNHAARFEILGNIYSKWYPNNVLNTYNGAFSVVYPVDFNSTIDPNQFGYNRGSEGINDFIITDIFTPYRDYIYKFPYRIHRGGKLSRQNTRSWKTFLALDYYETQKNMGFIVHLEGMDDRLLIHHENALFITQDKAKLESGLLGVTLGTGDLFQFEPQEVQSAKLGYGGTQHDLACVRTPIGYIYPDAKQGEIFLFKGKELTLLNQQIYRFLKEYLNIYGKNCFNGNSITIGWDQKYKRFLLTVNNVRPALPAGETVLQLSKEQIHSVTNTGQLLCSSTPNGPQNFTIDINDIVFMDGKYLQYMGLNDSNITGTSCPPDPVPCSPVTELSLNLIDETSAELTWTGTGPFNYVFSYQDASANWITIQSGTTSANTLTFTGLSVEVLYKFSIVRECDVDTSSNPAVVLFSTVGEVIDPVEECETGDVTEVFIDLPAGLIDPTDYNIFTSGPPYTGAPIPYTEEKFVSLTSTAFLVWRIRTNSGPWTPANPMGGYLIQGDCIQNTSGFGPPYVNDQSTNEILFKLGNVHRFLNLSGTDCCIEIEFGHITSSGSWHDPNGECPLGNDCNLPGAVLYSGTVAFPGDPGFDMAGKYGIEGLATRGMNQANILNQPDVSKIGAPPTFSSPFFLAGMNITPMNPDPVSAYTGVNENNLPVIGYYRWKLMGSGWFQGLSNFGGTNGTTASPATLTDAPSGGPSLPLIIYKP